MQIKKDLELIIQCCVCKKFKIKNDYINFNQEQEKKIYRDYKISHSYCPQCYKKEKEKLKNY